MLRSHIESLLPCCLLTGGPSTGLGSWATVAIGERCGGLILWGRGRRIKAPSPRFIFIQEKSPLLVNMFIQIRLEGEEEGRSSEDFLQIRSHFYRSPFLKFSKTLLLYISVWLHQCSQNHAQENNAAKPFLRKIIPTLTYM